VVTIKSEFIYPAIRMYMSHIKRRFYGFKRYPGDVKDILKAIIESAWNNEKKYFMVSSGHFTEFYIRDFCWVIKSLINLGYTEKVRKTLEYALNCYNYKGIITTTISPSGKPFDFPKMAVDSIPYLFRCMRILNDTRLIEKNWAFLQEQVHKYYVVAVDPKTGLLYDKHFSSMKDHYKRHCSCYDNSMLGMLAMDLKDMGFKSPFKNDYNDILINNFWTGEYFKDELNNNIISGDANTFPFWCGIITDEKILRTATESVSKMGLDSPFPLKYAQKVKNEHAFSLLSVLAKDYETNSIWTHMGPLYIMVVKKVDPVKAKKYIESYVEMIETYSNYLEVFRKDGRPFSTAFYTTDESMIWAANLLYLL
jgi:hypothetical protein